MGVMPIFGGKNARLTDGRITAVANASIPIQIICRVILELHFAPMPSALPCRGYGLIDPAIAAYPALLGKIVEEGMACAPDTPIAPRATVMPSLVQPDSPDCHTSRSSRFECRRMRKGSVMDRNRSDAALDAGAPDLLGA
jgi:hypothetical protein